MDISAAVPLEPWSASFVALLFVLPGLAWGPLVAPGASLATRLLGAPAVSLLTASVACTVLARLGMLAAGPVVGVLLALAVAPFLLPARRAGARRALASLRRTRARRWWLGAGAGAALLALLVFIPSRAAVGDELLPFSSTVWYYANLAARTADAGAFPAALAEWGTLRPFQVDYLPVTAHTAAAFVLAPGADVRMLLEVYRLAVLASAGATAVLLLRRFVSAWLAVAGAALLLGTVRLEGKFLAYRPETWALVPALYAIWLADRAIAERSRRLAAAAVATAAVTYLAHAEVFLLIGPAVLGLAIARAIVARGRVGLRRPPARAAGWAGGVLLAVFGGGLVAGSLAHWC